MTNMHRRGRTGRRIRIRIIISLRRRNDQEELYACERRDTPHKTKTNRNTCMKREGKVA